MAESPVLDTSLARAKPVQVGHFDACTLWLIGAGGTGSWLAPAVARVARQMKERGQMPTVYFVDPDTVSAANVHRQAFCDGEVSANKAFSLAARYSQAWGVEITALQTRFTVELFNAHCRWYSPYLNRWIQPDSIVPEPGNPQDLNRYAFVRNNPLKYTDPTGHCAGDSSDSNNPDAGCWGMISKIQGTYTNIQIDSASWTEEELGLVWNALAGHVFINDILSASHINLYRRQFYSHLHDGIGGATIPGSNKGDYNTTIYDDAYYLPPSGNARGDPDDLNFEGTMIHELAHVAMGQNSLIRESHSLRQGIPDTVGLGLTQLSQYAGFPIRILPFGNQYDYRTCGDRCDTEVIAMAAAIWQLTPLSVSNWQIEWIGQFYSPNPFALPVTGPTVITRGK